MVLVRSAPGRGRAERAGAVGRPDGDLVGQLQQPLHRPVLGAGQLLGAGWVDQVGASDGADQQGPSGEDPHGLVAVEQQEGQVLIGVPRGAQGAQPQAAEIGLVSVAQSGVVEVAAAGGGCQHRRGVRRRELAGAGEEVGMEVGVGGERDPQPAGRECVAHRAQVTARVHRERAAVAEVDEIRRVAQALVHEGDELGGRSRAPPRLERRSYAL